MRIQAANTIYTGTYSVFEYKSSFPYAVKVEGYGNTRNQRSLFQFAHVTITEHMVNAKIWYKRLQTVRECRCRPQVVRKRRLD